MSEILSQLNEAQREAAACTEGPVMIIAGAGSGKTRTLTYRIAHLIEKGVDPFNILALTFTNKAAGEMKERIIKLVGGDARNIWMGTFHSVFARILRAEAEKIGYIKTFTIYDTDDQKSAIKQIVKQLNLDVKTYSPNNVLSRISMAKSNLISPEEYANNVEIQAEDKAGKRNFIGQIYQMYNQRLRNAMAMDFDDLLYNTNVLLRDYPEVLLKYQNRFKYIHVDEYQDTNYAQYLIVKKLSMRLQNICVVGDDAQSIYAFRGADIRNILNFQKDYPNASLFKLEQNYRSTRMIVEASNSIIQKNRDKIDKHVWTDNGIGKPIRVFSADDERAEGTYIAQSIQGTHLAENSAYSDFAILYRTNSQSRALEDALRKMSIPYRIYSGISFYGRKEVKDVLAYLRLAINPHDDEAMLRAINYPARGIGQTTMDKVRLAAADNDVSICTVFENINSFALGLNSGITQKILSFVTMIKMFGAKVYTTDAYSLSKEIVNASGILKLLREDDDPDNPNRIENIEELLNGVQEFCEKEDLITPGNEEGATTVGKDGTIDLDNLLAEETPQGGQLKTLDLFLQQVLLLTSEDKGEDEGNKVSLMTIHAAKGLEFPHVFVAGMEEQIFPSFMSSTDRAGLEEERRLFYVAVTRAEKELVLTHALTRYQYGNSTCNELSRFVNEIDPNCIEYLRKRSAFPKPGELPQGRLGFAQKPTGMSPQFQKKQQEVRRNLKKIENTKNAPTMANSAAEIGAIQPGMRVAHAKFGTGRVLTIEGAAADRIAVVFFEGVGEKKLILKFAKLTIIG
ncbi:MAG: UvrD-helicase domain-containing protein [Bacteroidales bacterium]|nr:UvrD-helicase domain-containing protein [Bacteroidales bacterium]